MDIKKMLWVKTKDEAVIVIKDISLVLYVIFGFKAIGVFTRGLIPLEIIEWLLMLLMVLIVQKRKSRIASIILLLDIVPMQILQMVLSFLQLIKMMSAENPQILSITSSLPALVIGYVMNIVLIVSTISLTRATFVYNRKQDE